MKVVVIMTQNKTIPNHFKPNNLNKYPKRHIPKEENNSKSKQIKNLHTLSTNHLIMCPWWSW